MSIRKVPVTIVTDTICPWCYIGKKRFESAVTQYKAKNEHIEFEISYQPFQLDSTLPKEGISKLGHYHKKFGKDRFDQMNVHVKNIGAALGINFSYGGLIGNSLDSHRLVKYAGTVSNEAQNKVINSLYKSYFEQEENIADVEVLVKAGKAGGLDEKVVREQIVGGDLLKAETLQAVEDVH
ncbi:hypothetical protein HDU79_007236, partial [Rhizoclosmatium sp. JEL0117]